MLVMVVMMIHMRMMDSLHNRNMYRQRDMMTMMKNLVSYPMTKMSTMCKVSSISQVSSMTLDTPMS